MPSLPSPAVLEKVVAARDASYDGLFVFGVRTTGIFCRPSCPAKTALSKNRVYFPTPDEAQRAGFRPCRRCRPLAVGPHPEWMQSMFEAIDHHPQRLRDADLRAMLLAPARVRRYFKRQFGMTFHAWCRSRRMAEALNHLKHGESIEGAALAAGYESTSGFRDAFQRTLDETPSQARRHGCIVTAVIDSPVGPLHAGVCDEGVCLLEFADPERLNAQLDALRRCFSQPVVPGDHRLLDQLRDELARYFTGDLHEFRVPTVLAGTSFQQRVWQMLQTIPYGETRSYEWLAAQLGTPKGVRAVGQANGRNRIAIVIPCHRVVNKSGRLGGYGGGLWRKEILLDLERQYSAAK